MAEDRKFQVGGMWESREWEIQHDVEVKEERRCPHCGPICDKRWPDGPLWTGPVYIEKVCRCPRVIVAQDEVRSDATGVCLDCVLDAVKERQEIWCPCGFGPLGDHFAFCPACGREKRV